MLLKLALLPSYLFCIYIYMYDKDKEPFYMALLCLIYGAVSAFPIALIEKLIEIPIENPLLKALYEAFVTAALPEELVKLALLLLLIGGSKDFDTPFDGIFYSVFLCMGFAAAENIGYVFNPILGGLKTALLRLIFSVPCHGIFAAASGFFLRPKKLLRPKSLFAAFFLPFLLHGVYDFLLLYPLPHINIIFLSYFAFLVALCFILKKKAQK